MYEIQKNFSNELVKADSNVIPEGTKKSYVFIEQLTTYNYQSVSITGNIIVNTTSILNKSISITNVAGGYY